jgi:hypothetical protein
VYRRHTGKEAPQEEEHPAFWRWSRRGDVSDRSCGYKRTRSTYTFRDTSSGRKSTGRNRSGSLTQLEVEREGVLDWGCDYKMDAVISYSSSSRQRGSSSLSNRLSGSQVGTEAKDGSDCRTPQRSSTVTRSLGGSQLEVKREHDVSDRGRDCKGTTYVS